MALKPQRASEYESVQTEQARAACLHLATILGDLANDVTVIGGLAPGLIIDQQSGAERHVGTADLDVALSLAVFDEQRYAQIAARLRQHGFGPDRNEKGGSTPQRWRRPGTKITIDFLIAARQAGVAPGSVKWLEDDFAAIGADGADLAFHDRVSVDLDGLTLDGAMARREVWVSGPGAFTVLKARAFYLRGERKDAYDLVYLLANWPQGIADIAARMVRLQGEDTFKVIAEAVANLGADFATPDHSGPDAYARFVDAPSDAERMALQAQAYAYVADLLGHFDGTATV